jgi:hypothetical protein
MNMHLSWDFTVKKITEKSEFKTRQKSFINDKNLSLCFLYRIVEYYWKSHCENSPLKIISNSVKGEDNSISSY